MEKLGSIPEQKVETNKKLWAVTTVFRLFPGTPREENYFKMREALKLQGVRLCCVEVVVGDLPFFLSRERGDADILLQIRTPSVFWHKERALNIAASLLPVDCEYVAWIDADSVVDDRELRLKSRRSWADAAIDVLQSGFPAVQLCWRLNYLTPKEEVGVVSYSYTYIKHNGVPSGHPSNIAGFPGFGWAVRKEFFDKVGMHDCHIVGGGDLLFGDSFSSGVGDKYRVSALAFLYKDLRLDYEEWKAKVVSYAGGMRATYLGFDGIHYFHGELPYRLYAQRHALLHLHKFNPKTDLEIGEDELYRIKESKKEMASALYAFFWMREQPRTPLHDELFKAYSFWLGEEWRKVRTAHKGEPMFPGTAGRVIAQKTMRIGGGKVEFTARNKDGEIIHGGA